MNRFVYTPSGVRELDRIAINDAGIPGYTLMKRAGQAAFDAARGHYADARGWLILCGAGNNAGDGYVIARLAKQAQLEVTVAAQIDPARLTGDAAQAWNDYRAIGGEVTDFSAHLPDKTDLVIDALLGTGLDRPLSPDWCEIVRAINQASAPVIAIDIPTGLNGSTGEVMGEAIMACLTVTFVGLKQGLFLGAGPDYTGEIIFDDLGIPDEIAQRVAHSLSVFDQADLDALLPPRLATANKGRFGHVLVIGGNHGMGGAVRLAAEAALRSGAGLVTVATRPENVVAVSGRRPELMCRGIAAPAELEPLLERASVVALGPGLGRDAWAQGLLEKVKTCVPVKILDADALNLLAEAPVERDDWILTPHPGEAARLLARDTASIQADRLAALEKICARYGGVTVLKGSCTLVGMAGALPYLINRGNPGMATAGMGDVLTGLIAGVVAQAPADLHRSAAAAAYLHAAAGDLAAQDGERGLIASDLFAFLKSCLNASH